ncbi:MAG TPA: hypothetical protein VFU81_14525 [Thermomicrobiales bacterium]|nr:hypothetical protein [Thermomicrobiales bacterium]
MDGDRSDGLIKGLSAHGLERRDALKTVAVGALGLALDRLALDRAGATAHKRKHKKRCVKPRKACPMDPATCCSQQCCLEIGAPEGGPLVCSQKNAVCCTAANGAGACDPDFPQCCPPTDQDPTGSCTPTGFTCCTSKEGGGACRPDQPTCCPPDTANPDGWCCAGADCCAAPGANARARSAPRAPREGGHRRR